MSGVCGVLALDGRPPEGAAAMLAALERRGPEGTRIWTDGPVALGHALLATTPEALHETLPLVDPATGCAITADARLDNREDLLAALALPPGIGDGGLILRAWLAWGEACLDRLLGDFAFAIWDPRTRRLLAARDQIGMRQLAYAHVPGKVFAFATEPRVVLEARDVPRSLDEGRVLDFLAGHLESVDLESTFHTAVRRLPPGHLLRADAAGVTVRPYWSLQPGPPLRLGSDEAYAEAFLEVFTEAVRCRLRGAGPVGSMLSGGMDSGSVVAVASRLLAAEGRGPLPTFSVVGPDPHNYAETLAIHASLGMPGLDPHLVDIADLSDWQDDLIAALRQLDEPFDGHMNLPRAAYLAARRAGVKVVLDGGAGDIVLHAGSDLAHLARSGRLLALWREAGAEARFWGDRWTRGQALRAGLRQAAIPDWLRRLRLRLNLERDAPRPGRHLSPTFAREAGLRARNGLWRRNQAQAMPLSEGWRAALVVGPDQVAGRERFDRVAGALGVEPRDPFSDLRVIDFCLRCPPDRIKARGWPKLLLRNAMRGLLPEEVIWRRGRTHLGWSMTQQLLAGGEFTPPDGTAASAPARELFRRATGLDHGQLATAGLEDQELWDCWYLALWLESGRGPWQDQTKLH